MNEPKFNYRREYQELETNFIDEDYLPIAPNDLHDKVDEDDFHGIDAPGDYQDWPVGGLEGDGVD